MEQYRKGVLAIIINKSGKILIGSSPRDDGFKFPQGGVDAGENSIDAIKREVLEETGINILKENILPCKGSVTLMFSSKGVKKFKGKYVGQKMEVYLIKYNENNLKIIPQKNKDDGEYEFDEFIWIFPKKLNKYDFRHRLNTYNQALSLYKLLE